MKLTPEQSRKLRLLQLMAEKQKRLQLSFDADILDSRPTPKQMEIIQSQKNVHYIIGSNRCLAEGTMVMTPSGPVAIQDIKVGDTVYDEHGKEIPVLKTFDQGMQEVVELTHYGRTWAECTDNHVWQVTTNKGSLREATTADIIKKRSRNYYTINRTEVDCPLGHKSVPQAYALGAFLGDGCSRQDRKSYLSISSGDNVIPLAVASQLGCELRKNSDANYTWQLMTGTDSVPFYKQWCSGRYAHEKIVDLEEVKSWDRQSVLKLLAGIIDTDGSVYVQPDGVVLSCNIQAESVIDFVHWAFLALWQIDVPRYVDDRPKYKTGPVHYVALKNRHQVSRALKDLSPYLHTVRKQWNPNWDQFVAGGKFNPRHLGVKPGKRRQVKCYDIHVGSDTNLYLLANGLVTHNSGKSQLGSRIVSWWFNENHPYLERPKKWGTKPLTILMIGQVGSQMDTELWNNKLKKFLKPGTYRVVRQGNAIDYIEHKENGNRIVFIAHLDPDAARKKAQAYTAQVVWLDEMPAKSGILSELRLRVFDEDGYMYCTFTPLLRNQEIRKIVDSAVGRSCKWFISILDNPKFSATERQDIIDELRSISASEAEFQARLNGEWMGMETAVFMYNPDKNWVDKLPDGYDPGLWPHVAVVDQASSGNAGLSVWAREPKRDIWYCVKARYMRGEPSSQLVQSVEREIESFNVVKRICDCNPSGYYKEAMLQGIKYHPITDKAFNKENSIDGANSALAKQQVYLTRGAEILAEELTMCSRSEDNPERIVKASKYHTADTFRYFLAKKPIFTEIKAEPRPEERIRVQWKERLTKEAEHAKRTKMRSMRRQRRALGVRRWM